MQTDDGFAQSPIELLEAITALRVTARSLATEARNAGQVFAHNPERLRETVETLGCERAAKPPVCLDGREQWTDFLGKRRTDIEPRALRFLCWEPDVATDRRFHDYVDRSPTELRARALQGLVRSCHERWSNELFAKDGVGSRTRRRVDDYEGSNRILRRWRDASRMILGPSGPAEIAYDMVENLRPIKAQCALWTLEEQSRFVLEAAERAAERCRNQLETHSPTNQYLLRELLPWSGWPLDQFKREVGATILTPAITQAADLTEGLKRFVLHDDRLRDPRLPANSTNWLGIPEEAKHRFIQWLSRDDIEFFFEHVLPRGSDPHGRKAFWLRYLKRIQMSRPLLNWRDEARLKARMKEIGGQAGNYGRIGGFASTSAFLLDFGRVLVVEFSQTGNACRLYARGAVRDVVPDFWTTDPFEVSGNRGLKQPIFVARVVHRAGWQADMTSILAHHGVRPLSGDDQ